MLYHLYGKIFSIFILIWVFIFDFSILGHPLLVTFIFSINKLLSFNNYFYLNYIAFIALFFNIEYNLNTVDVVLIVSFCFGL